MPVIRPSRVLLVASAVAMSAACGSTVQLSTTTSGDPGLGQPSTATMTGSMQAPQTGGVTPGGSATSGQLSSAGAGTAAGAAPPTSSRGAARASTAGSVVDLPGVTKSTFTVGVIAADPSTDKTLDNAGFGAASLGNEPANWQAAADEVNAHGGIAGRRLTLVFYLVNLTESPTSQGQKACARFTQDNKVALVLSGYYYAPAHLCLSQHGVPALLGTNYGVDRQLAKQTPTVVAWATPMLDRLAALLPGAFQRMGKLKAGTTAGIFVTDAAAFRRSAARLSAALTQRGVKVVIETVRDSDTGDYSGATSDASAAVLKFRSAHVTEIMFLTHNAFEPTELMQAANSQSYKPTYLLSTQQYPATLVGLVPPGQLDHALAVGWAPAIDLNSGYDASPEARRCLTALKKHGRTYSSGGQALVGLLACDGVGLLKGAAELRGALSSRAALNTAALDPATGFVSTVTFKSSFPQGRRDGVAAYRPMAYSTGCGCFTYTGPVTDM